MLELDERDDVVVIRMCHGPVNALDLTLVRELAATFRDRAADRRPLLLTGAGMAFSAGVDLRQITDGGPGYVAEFLPALSEAFLAVFEHPAPVVAAINGHALAGGCIVAVACDVRVAAPDAGVMGVTELLVGVPYPTTALEILRHAVGDRHAARLVVTGARLTMVQAHAVGAITHLVETADATERTATALAVTLGGLQRPAYALAKQQLRRHALRAIADNRHVDDEAVERIWAATDTMAAIHGYLDALKGH